MRQHASSKPDPARPEDEEELPEEDLGSADADLPEHDGPYASHEDREQMLRDRTLEHLLRGIIGRKVPLQDVDDVLQVTLMAAYHTERLPAGAGKERNRYVAQIAVFKIADYFRRAERQVERVDDAEADDVMPAGPPAVDKMEERDLLGNLLVVEMADRQKLWCWVRHKMGEELTAIAEDVGVGYEKLRRQVADMEERVNRRVEKLGKYGRITGVLVMLLGLGATWRVARVPAMGPDHPDAVVVLEPAVSTHVSQTDPTDWAAVLRGEAYRACMDYRWRDCLDGLDAARDLDPDGPVSPAEIAARSDADLGSLGMRKPGEHFVPKGRHIYGPWASR